MFLHFRQDHAARCHVFGSLFPVGVRANFLLRGRGERSSVILVVILFLNLPLSTWFASFLRRQQQQINRDVCALKRFAKIFQILFLSQMVISSSLVKYYRAIPRFNTKTYYAVYNQISYKTYFFAIWTRPR